MGRPFDRHIDGKELEALVLSRSETGSELNGLAPDAVREARRHVQSCADCRTKVWKYRQFVNQSSHAVIPQVAPPGVGCPNDEDVDWHEVVAGLWPEARARQLIMHAAVCDHCGPLLRVATSMEDDPTVEEEKLLAQLKAPARPLVEATREPIAPPAVMAPSAWRRFLQWKVLVPAVALLAIVGVLVTRPLSSSSPLSGLKFSEFAVNVHREHTQGSLALDFRSDSQQRLNDWLKAKSQFSLVLPALPPAPGEERPYQLEGARLLPVAGKTAAYIAYQRQTDPVSLVVTPDSVAVASGGVEADFKKVTFHYRTVEGYKVVTWSLHGLTYALVSQESNSTQRSCMVCHSAMRDRDLSHTPTPLRAERTGVKSLFQ